MVCCTSQSQMSFIHLVLGTVIFLRYPREYATGHQRTDRIAPMRPHIGTYSALHKIWKTLIIQKYLTINILA